MEFQFGAEEFDFSVYTQSGTAQGNSLTSIEFPYKVAVILSCCSWLLYSIGGGKLRVAWTSILWVVL